MKSTIKSKVLKICSIKKSKKNKDLHNKYKCVKLNFKEQRNLFQDSLINNLDGPKMLRNLLKIRNQFQEIVQLQQGWSHTQALSQLSIVQGCKKLGNKN